MAKDNNAVKGVGRPVTVRRLPIKQSRPNRPDRPKKMKKYGNLYERVCSIDNLREAFYNASIGKRNRDDVLEYGAHLEENLEELRRELTGHTYKTSEYHIFKLYEPKERIIYKLPFRDRVVHWAIMLQVETIWINSFTRDTYACVKGRGIHSLLSKLNRDLKNDPDGTAYCLKLDVKKFYPTIDHDILKQVIRYKLKDPDLLWLLDEIIGSTETGVPIGNYLSQFFANLYLSELDHLLKEEYGVRYYYRYADDIVLLSDDKAKLHGWLVVINDYLNERRKLTIKANYQIFPVESRGELLTIQYILQEDVQCPDGKVAKAGEKHISFTGSEALAKMLRETEQEDYPCLAKIIKQQFGDKGNSFYTIVDPDD